MEITYKTDLYISYLLITGEGELDHNKYSFKMLEKNKIKGVLSCKHRMEDGKSCLYLDITGKKNLYQEYQDREMSFEEMTDLFQKLIAILEGLREYLLTEKMIILEPEFIYRDMENKEVYLTVVPWEREESFPLRKLAEFLLEKMNHLEENGVSAVYHFYRSQSQPQFSIYQFLPILERENILSRQKNNKDDYEMGPTTEQKESRNFLSETEIEKEEEHGVQEQEQNRSIWIYSIVAAFTVLVLVFLPITQKNQKIACLGLAIALFILGIVNKITQNKKMIKSSLVK